MLLMQLIGFLMVAISLWAILTMICWIYKKASGYSSTTTIQKLSAVSKRRPKLYIALDLDGTIVKDKYPNIGELRFMAKWCINWMKKRGHCLILWTCRDCEWKKKGFKTCLLTCLCCVKDNCKLVDAIDYLGHHKINFDYINENPIELCEKYNTDPRKIGYDILFDDKAGFRTWLFVPITILLLEWRKRK